MPSRMIPPCPVFSSGFWIVTSAEKAKFPSGMRRRSMWFPVGTTARPPSLTASFDGSQFSMNSPVTLKSSPNTGTLRSGWPCSGRADSSEQNAVARRDMFFIVLVFLWRFSY